MIEHAPLIKYMLRYRLLQWPDERTKLPDTLSDIFDGAHWGDYALGDTKLCPDGAHLGRNLTFMISGDGVSLYKRGNYSMWPLALACGKLPGHLRMTLPSTWVSCIIPAQGKHKGEPKDFQPFLDIVADELNAYYHVGLEGVMDSTHRTASQ